MKLHSSDSSTVLNTVTGYGDGYIEVNKVRYEHSVLVMPEGAVVPWDVARFEDLTPDHFARLLEMGAEVVIFGTGNKLRFPHPRLTAPLTEKRIGVEAMDIQAAGRTYNILMLEGRKVATALLIEHS